MHRFVKHAVFVAGLAFSSSAVAETTVTQVSLEALVPHCEKPMATLLVGAIACKASGCAQSQDTTGFGRLAQLAQMQEDGEIVDLSQVGQGTTNALITSLKATGCFDIQEREILQQLKEEAALAGIEFKPKTADFLITGAITSIAVTKKTSALAGGVIPVVGAFSKSKRNAEVTLDIRIVETASSTIKASQAFNVSSQTSNWKFGAAGYSGGLALGGASSTRSPELDTVVNEVVIKAAQYVADTLALAGIVSRPEVKVSQ